MKKILFLWIAIGVTLSATAQKQSEANRKLSLSEFAISSLYVDSVDETKLVEDAIRGMLQELDPHSTYMTPEEVKELNETMQGNFEGIGIQFEMYKDTLYVIQTVPGGPSEKVGLLAGDRILTVNDTLIAGVGRSNTEIMNLIRGKKGTTVVITVLRRGQTEPMTFKIIRDQIPIHSLDAAYMATPNTGYIRLNRFGATTHQEFVEAVKKLKKQGMKNLILDLQGNGGGYLNSSIEIADELLDDKKLIVYTQGRKMPREDAIATKEGIFQKGKLVVLVEGSSASASAIVSGAIQDWDRGIIVGRRTFGKGLVQRPVPLPDGSMIRLTVSRYYTPSGRSIQRPYTDGVDQYNQDLIERYNRGELTNADSIHFPDSLKVSTLLNQRTVYGGGGIMPDDLVPLDTTRFTKYLGQVVAAGILNSYCTDYIDRNRAEIQTHYKTLDRYIESFTVSDAMVNEVIAAAEKEKITPSGAITDQEKATIRDWIKSLLARDLFNYEAYIQVSNLSSDTYQKALEIIENDELYNQLLGVQKK